MPWLLIASSSCARYWRGSRRVMVLMPFTLSAESAQLEEDVAVETADFDRSLCPQPGRNRRTFAARERGFMNEDMCGRQRLQPVPRSVGMDEGILEGRHIYLVGIRHAPAIAVDDRMAMRQRV